ncbi:hypothetical protein ACFVGM_08590 [Kitasatospora purpeofusca]|uniref:hypothetical protein n=1 Tax=Kitasatospora purpeofusca TaxID=67352 RepID=UPI0036CE7D08
MASIAYGRLQDLYGRVREVPAGAVLADGVANELAEDWLEITAVVGKVCGSGTQLPDACLAAVPPGSDEQPLPTVGTHDDVGRKLAEIAALRAELGCILMDLIGACRIRMCELEEELANLKDDRTSLRARVEQLEARLRRHKRVPATEHPGSPDVAGEGSYSITSASMTPSAPISSSAS